MGCFHDEITIGDNHVVQQYSYADATARNAASGFLSTDIGKIARQLDNESFWILTATTPTWSPINTTALTPATTVTDETTLGITAAAGSSSNYAREDHTHGTPSSNTISAGAGTVIRNYLAGAAVRDVVYQRSDAVAVQASATTVITGIASGFVEALDSPAVGQAVIRFSGDLGGFSGLSPGKLYILGKAVGTIVEETDTGNGNYPDVTPQSGHVINTVGMAVSTTVLCVNIDRDFIEN